MKQLTAIHQQLIEQYMYVVPIAYNKILWIDDVSAYKEEIISEGYMALCTASMLYNSELDENPFPYFFKAALTRMLTFIKKFIFPQNYAISLEDNIELVETLTAIPGESSIASTDIFIYIDDLITSYKHHVLESEELTSLIKERRTSAEYLKKLKFILLCLYLGYTQPEIGKLLQISKQAVHQQLLEFKNIIKTDYEFN